MTTRTVVAVTPIVNGRSTRWMDDEGRKCLGKSWDVFFPVERVSLGGGEFEEQEPTYPPPETKKLCDACPVRADCLNYALETGQEGGIWGGMTDYQRKQISRRQSRKSCPDCGGHDIVVERDHEICLPCGISWPVVDTRDDA